MTKEALKLALEALVNTDSEPSSKSWKREIEAITAIKQVLAQPAQKPCGGCKGSGWVTRDPDIGTDQECFVCGGSGAYPKEPEQEPVVCDCDSPSWCKQYKKCNRKMLGFMLYVAQPQRTWVGLTNDERIELAQDVDWAIGAYCEYAEKIEAKLKAKNVL